MYLVTWEDDDGMWLDDPEGFDTLTEAKIYAAQHPARRADIYSCSHLMTVEASSGSGTERAANECAIAQSEAAQSCECGITSAGRCPVCLTTPLVLLQYRGSHD